MSNKLTGAFEISKEVVSQINMFEMEMDNSADRISAEIMKIVLNGDDVYRHFIKGNLRICFSRFRSPIAAIYFNTTYRAGFTHWEIQKRIATRVLIAIKSEFPNNTIDLIGFNLKIDGENVEITSEFSIE